MEKDRGFTLVELLVVIGILAVLMLVAVLIINPTELYRQSRDGVRITDMNTLNKAVGLYYADAINNPSTLFMGTSSVIYVSIPDPAATSTAGDQCQGLGLPGLPTGYTYKCAASSTYKNVNGTGWIPINFGSFSGGNYISALPTDPVNATSSNLYYTYQTDGIGGYEVAAFLESQKDSSLSVGDGGYDANIYEKGTDLLLPTGRGEIGYWPLNEGSGSSSIDYSGNNVTGTWSGTAAGTSGYYSAGKVGPWAGNFDGSTDNISLGNLSYTKTLPFSVSFWFYPRSTVSEGIITQYTSASFNGFNIFTNSGYLNAWYLRDSSDYAAISQQGGVGSISGYQFTLNTWTYATITVSSSGMQMYINGSLYTSSPWTGTAAPTTESNSLILGDYNSTYFNGLLDEVRIFDTALPAAQIQEMYYAEK